MTFLHNLLLFLTFILISFFSLLAGHFVAKYNCLKHQRKAGIQTDEITDIAIARLDPAVSKLIESNNIRIFKFTTRDKTFIAAASRGLKMSSILIEFNCDLFSPSEESFIIAHEVGHIVQLDSLVRFVINCFAISSCMMLAMQLTPGGSLSVNPIISVPILFGILPLLYTLLIREMTAREEFRADAFALRFIEAEHARSSLNYAKTIARDEKVLHTLNRRLERIARVTISTQS